MIFLTINIYSIRTNINYKSPKITIFYFMISTFLNIESFSLSLVANFPFIIYFFTILFTKKITTINFLIKSFIYKITFCIFYLRNTPNISFFIMSKYWSIYFNSIYISNSNTTGRRITNLPPIVSTLSI